MFFMADAFPADTVQQYCGPIQIQAFAAAETAGSAATLSVDSGTSRYWKSLNDSVLKLDGYAITFPSPAAPPPPAVVPTDITVELASDGVDENGRWTQKLRVTIRPNGTLGDVSEAIYGDDLEIDRLLELAKQQLPHVQRPQNLQIGDVIEIDVDPTITYVVKDSQWNEVQGKLTKNFYNGASEVTYPDVKSGYLRLVEVPADSRAQSFAVKTEQGTVVTLPPGSRLAEYSYRKGDTFQGVVRAIYGDVTGRALQDFILQTHWTADQWPPAPDDRKQLIVSTTTSWADVRPIGNGIPEETIVKNDQYRALMERRAQVGIFPLRREGSGTLYEVAIVDPAITAKDVANLLYGSDANYLSLATSAGIKPPADATGKIPATFNPPMLGTVFQVYLDYTEEWFPISGPAYEPSTKRTVTKLSDGTIIEEYDAYFRHQTGMQRGLYYPTGYKRIVYRASDLTYAGLDFAYFISTGFKYNPNSEDDKQGAQDFMASFLWNWAPSIPRAQGDVPDSFNVVDTPDGKNVEIIIGPTATNGLVPFLLYDIWLANPCLSALGVVFFATILVFVVGVVFRRKREGTFGR